MQSNRRLLIPALLAYLSFVIYGSLVPLDYTPKPWPDAIAGFVDMPLAPYTGYSRTDWATNILLFIPLAFLVMAVAAPARRAWAVALSLLLLPAAATLSAAIEFTQQFFPPRSTGLNDIIAETLGAAIGVGLWWWQGRRFDAAVRSWRRGHSLLSLTEQLFVAYACLLLLFNVLPLDLTISPVELYRKWSAGMLVLVPLTGPYDGIADMVYSVIVDSLVWVPAGALLVFGSSSLARRPVLAVFAAALLIETAQLFVFSRVTDTTDVLSATLGGTLGVALSRRFLAGGRGGQETRGAAPAPPMSAPWIALFAWGALLTLVFWFPFEISTERAFVAPRLAGFFELPLATLFYESEFHAATQLLRKTLWFAPLGVLLAWLRSTRRFARWRLADLFALALVAGFVVGIELGQVAMPGKVAISTDVLIQGFGVLLGYLVTRKLLRTRLAVESTAQSAPTPRSGPPPGTPLPGVAAATRPRQRPTAPGAVGMGTYALVLLACCVLVWLSTTSALAPYNLRELTEKFPPPIGAVGLMLAVVVAFAPFAWLGRRLIDTHRVGWFWLLAILVAHTLLLFVLLRIAVPLESLNDILGSVKPWRFAEPERLLRFAGLFLAIGSAIIGGVASWHALRSPSPDRILRPLLLAAGCFALGYWVVVIEASTDNLTELVRGSGSLAGTLALFAWLWLTALIAYVLVQAVQHRLGAGLVVPALLFGTGLGLLLLWVGFEPRLEKYGAEFSALQFLLSPDRSQYVQGLPLAGRALLMQLAITGLMTVAFLTTALRPAGTLPAGAIIDRRTSGRAGAGHSSWVTLRPLPTTRVDGNDHAPSTTPRQETRQP
jgi:glycopeptide antibiotics resistance protein